MDDLSPQAGGFEHVRLVDGSDVVPALAGKFKGDLCNARHLFHAVFFGIVGKFAAFAHASAALAEVNAADEFAHDHEVNAFLGDVFSQGAGSRQGGEQLCGAQVGIKPQRRTDL